jgi:hypothetical protein
MTYKTLRRIYPLQFLLFPLITFLSGVASWKLFQTFIPAMIVGGICLVLFLFLSVRLILWKWRAAHSSESGAS